MGDEKVCNAQTSYYSLSNDFVWPDAIKTSFAERFGDHDNIIISTGSDEEHRFLQLCREYGLQNTVFKSEMINCSMKEWSHYPFYQLFTKADRWYPRQSFMDYTHRCRSKVGVCSSGAVQVSKIEINPAKSKKFDIMEIPGDRGEGSGILVVSKRLQSLMALAGLTGYRLIPCLNTQKAYPEWYRNIDAVDPEMEQDSEFSQLVITEAVAPGPYVGAVGKWRTCDECGVMRGWYPDIFDGSSGYFHKGDLKEVDFQQHHGCISSNLGSFTSWKASPIVSAKVIELIVENRITGISPYFTSPKVPLAAVSIRD